MIHIYGFYPHLEKRVYATVESGCVKPFRTTYKIEGESISCFEYLQNIESKMAAHIMVGHHATGLINRKKDIHVLETSAQTKVLTRVIVDDDKYAIYEDVKQIVVEQDMQIYESVSLSYLNANDIAVMSEGEGYLDVLQFDRFYTALQKRQAIGICDLHEKYFSILKVHPCHVLLVSASQIEKILGISFISETQVVEYVKKELLTLAKEIVVSINTGKLLVFVNGETTKATYSEIKQEDGFYAGAMLGAMASCYEQQAEFSTFIIKTLAASVGAGLSKGLLPPQKDVLAKIESKIRYFKI